MTDETATPGHHDAPAPEPATEPEVPRIREWVTLRGASMDVRVGVGLSGSVARDLRSAIGKPHGCALVHEAGAPSGLLRDLARDLSDQGFDLHVIELGQCGRTLGDARRLAELLAGAHVTADDLAVVCGGTDTLGVASFVCSRWCGGLSLAEVPLDLTSAVTAGTTPAAIDVPGLGGALAQEGSARFSLVDVSLLDLDPGLEDVRMALVHMVVSAMCDSDKAFARLWDQADALMASDRATYVAQLADSVKSRGRVISSSALSTRQSIGYGSTFAAALASLVAGRVEPSAMLADGMRFAARLAAAQQILSVDDVLAQDELLDRLGIGTCGVPVDPEALVKAIKEERFRRTRRLMLALPRSIGRVRLCSIEDDLLREHVGAWCSVRG